MNNLKIILSLLLGYPVEASLNGSEWGEVVLKEIRSDKMFRWAWKGRSPVPDWVGPYLTPKKIHNYTDCARFRGKK